MFKKRFKIILRSIMEDTRSICWCLVGRLTKVRIVLYLALEKQLLTLCFLVK